jgi:hypothetical protein
MCSIVTYPILQDCDPTRRLSRLVYALFVESCASRTDGFLSRTPLGISSNLSLLTIRRLLHARQASPLTD